MPGKTTRRRATARRPEAEVVAADSAIARVVDRAFENPAMSGGLMVMAITAMAIMSNALFLQAGRHPEPLFATRPAAAPQAAPSAQVPRAAPARADGRQRSRAADARGRLRCRSRRRPPRRRRRTPTRCWSPPCSASLPASASTPARSTASWARAPGRRSPPGRRPPASTPPASRRPSLLAALRKPVAAARPRAAPVPAVVRQAAAPTRSPPPSPAPRNSSASRRPPRRRQELRAVQVALNQIGYGPLPVDGQPSRPTGDAIRRFQLDNGLPVTGETERDGRRSGSSASAP